MMLREVNQAFCAKNDTSLLCVVGLVVHGLELGSDASFTGGLYRVKSRCVALS